jgi:hypothetical protein
MCYVPIEIVTIHQEYTLTLIACTNMTTFTWIALIMAEQSCTYIAIQFSGMFHLHLLSSNSSSSPVKLFL